MFVAINLEPRASLVGRFATHHQQGILFIVFGLCLAGVYSALTMPSSVFPQTNFPRVIIMVDNGVMPADEMMAKITQPIENAMKAIPGVVKIRSQTGRGSSAISVFFNWKTDMVQSELYVLSRLEQVRASLPSTVSTQAYRMTFSTFPIIGISLTTTSKRPMTELWEKAQYEIKPRLLMPGVARVDLVGGKTPEYHVVVDPLRLGALGLSLAQVTETLSKSNLVASAGMHEEKHTLFLTLIDGRVHSQEEIENLVVGAADTHPIRIKDFARVKAGEEPVYQVVTADGVSSVLLNIRSQPDGSTLDIADALQKEIAKLKRELPPDMKLAFFYDQSLLVRESVSSVWDAIIFGLILSVLILYFFLKDWGSTIVATLVIPVTVLVTLVAMRLLGMSFNLMTLGGIAAAIGLVIDDAIVVVEAIYTKMLAGLPRAEAVHQAIGEIFLPLTGSTLTPVVVFVPLAFLDGIAGVFFRALAITMAVSLLTSLLLAITLTPSLAAWIIRVNASGARDIEHVEQGGFVLSRVMRVYESAVRVALRHRFITVGLCGLLLIVGIWVYQRLATENLPKMDEGGFVLDYVIKPGTSLAEADHELLEVEDILKHTEEVESYSRRTGTALGLELVEPHTGDFLVKLKPDRKRTTEDVIADLRAEVKKTKPGIDWEFKGVLSDLINDLTGAPEEIEIKIFSTDMAFLKQTAPKIEDAIKARTEEGVQKGVVGVVDTKSGLIVSGPLLTIHVRPAAAQRFGIDAGDVATAVNTAKFGQIASSMLKGDRVISIRVVVDPKQIDTAAKLINLPIRTPGGQTILLNQVADIREEPGQLEMRREDNRQNAAVTGRLEKRDLGSAMAEIQAKIGKEFPNLPGGTIEYGGQFQQQQESFRNLAIVMIMAILLVFTVLLFEFRSFLQPVAIVLGAVLALLGTVVALWITDTSLNIISLLGAIIGIGIVAKNGILMLDYVDHLRESGLGLEEALVQSGRRRLRPVLMTSMAAALGMLPLAYGIGSGADTLRPLAIAVIGALCVSVLLSLVATPTVFYLLSRLLRARNT